MFVLHFSKVRLQAIKKMEEFLTSALQLGDAETIQVIVLNNSFFLFITMALLFKEHHITGLSFLPYPVGGVCSAVEPVPASAPAQP